VQQVSSRLGVMSGPFAHAPKKLVERLIVLIAKDGGTLLMFFLPDQVNNYSLRRLLLWLDQLSFFF
jgi:hypothetical protein